MNWSWSRNRGGKFHDDRKQKEFFEKQKFLSAVKRKCSPVRKHGISQDLLSMQTVAKVYGPNSTIFSDRVSRMKHPRLSGQIIQVDLDDVTPHGTRPRNLDLGSMSPHPHSKLEIMDTTQSCVASSFESSLSQLTRSGCRAFNSVDRSSSSQLVDRKFDVDRPSSGRFGSMITTVEKFRPSVSLDTPFQPYTKPAPRVSFSTHAPQLHYNDSYDEDHKSPQLFNHKPPTVRRFWEQETPVLMGKPGRGEFPGKPAQFDAKKNECETPCLDYGDYLRKEAPQNTSFKFPVSSSSNEIKMHEYYKRQALVHEDFQITPLRKYSKEASKHRSKEKRKRNDNPQSKSPKYKSKEKRHRNDKPQPPTKSPNVDHIKSETKKTFSFMYHPQEETETETETETDVLDILDDSKFIKEHEMSNDYFNLEFDEKKERMREDTNLTVGQRYQQMSVRENVLTNLCEETPGPGDRTTHHTQHIVMVHNESLPPQFSENNTGRLLNTTDDEAGTVTDNIVIQDQPLYRNRLCEMLMSTPAPDRCISNAPDIGPSNAPDRCPSNAPDRFISNAPDIGPSNAPVLCPSNAPVQEPEDEFVTEAHAGYNKSTHLNTSWMKFVTGANVPRIPSLNNGGNTRENGPSASDEIHVDLCDVNTGRSKDQTVRARAETEATLKELICLEAEDDLELQRNLDLEEEIQTESIVNECEGLFNFEENPMGMIYHLSSDEMLQTLATNRTQTPEIIVKDTEVNVKDTEVKVNTSDTEVNVKDTEVKVITRDTEVNVKDTEVKVNTRDTEVKMRDIDVVVEDDRKGTEDNVNGTEVKVKDSEDNVKDAEVKLKGTEVNVKDIEDNVKDAEVKVKDAEVKVKDAEVKVKDIVVDLINNMIDAVIERSGTLNYSHEEESDNDIQSCSNEDNNVIDATIATHMSLCYNSTNHNAAIATQTSLCYNSANHNAAIATQTSLCYNPDNHSATIATQMSLCYNPANHSATIATQTSLCYNTANHSATIATQTINDDKFVILRHESTQTVVSQTHIYKDIQSEDNLGELKECPNHGPVETLDVALERPASTGRTSQGTMDVTVDASIKDPLQLNVSATMKFQPPPFKSAPSSAPYRLRSRH